MGRHIFVAASPVDEPLLLGFLRERADIKIFRSFASTVEELWLDEFALFGPRDSRYFIWNTKYAWEPNYMTRNGNEVYIGNALHGPVISFRRTDMERLLTKDLAVGAYGGIHWAQYNRQKGYLAWYEAIVRWIRRTGVNLEPGTSSAVYALPDALRHWRAREK